MYIDSILIGKWIDSNEKWFVFYLYLQYDPYLLLIQGFGGVTDLIAEPDYRAVRLSWTCEQSIGLLGFNIRYCEIAHWAMKTRCREQNILLKPEREQIGVDIDEPVIRLHMTGLNRFEAAVTNLRMLTNYSINVWPNYGENSPSFINHDKSIDQLDQLPTFVETKSCNVFEWRSVIQKCFIM